MPKEKKVRGKKKKQPRKKNDPRKLEILDACHALGLACNNVRDFDDMECRGLIGECNTNTDVYRLIDILTRFDTTKETLTQEMACRGLIGECNTVTDVYSIINILTAHAAHFRRQEFLAGNNFLNTDDFRRLLIPFIPDDTLMAMRLASKPWSRVADAYIDDGMRSEELIVHGGKDLKWKTGTEAKHKLVTRVIFLLNITKVEKEACRWAINLVVVDIPEGVVRIGDDAFRFCTSLTTVSFPTTLRSIGGLAFGYCMNFDNVDLLHTNLQRLGREAFGWCYELKSMTIPDSLVSLGEYVFFGCSKLVPSSIDANDFKCNTHRVVAHLRSKQQT